MWTVDWSGLLWCGTDISCNFSFHTGWAYEAEYGTCVLWATESIAIYQTIGNTFRAKTCIDHSLWLIGGYFHWTLNTNIRNKSMHLGLFQWFILLLNQDLQWYFHYENNLDITSQYKVNIKLNLFTLINKLLLFLSLYPVCQETVMLWSDCKLKSTLGLLQLLHCTKKTLLNLLISSRHVINFNMGNNHFYFKR